MSSGRIEPFGSEPMAEGQPSRSLLFVTWSF
jgi:hypothetical protein